jgi:DNA-binding NtrC family response regulator
VKLSPVAQELLWLYLAQPDLVGSVRDFSIFLTRSVDEIVSALDELKRYDCLRASLDAAEPAASAVVFVPLSADRRRALTRALGGGGVRRPPTSRRNGFAYSSDLVGRDPRMSEVYAMIDRVSRTNATVLLLGESGVGKEVVARTIHTQSLRAEGPLTIIDCAAIPAALLESELFGHEQGSFTSALRKQIGRFEAADGGTIFLDEVAELPLDLQGKLLRALQTRQFTRVGGTTPITVDVRFIAATNRPLESMVRARTFREDLFYRLNVIAITVPPLRERPGDIPLLSQRIVTALAHRDGTLPRRLTPDALARLKAHAWPGNVRELENVLERALIVSQDSEISAEDIVLAGDAPAPGAPPAALKSLREVEIAHIRHVVAATGGNESEAARILGIHRDTLYRKLRRYSISVRPQNTTPRVS